MTVNVIKLSEYVSVHMDTKVQHVQSVCIRIWNKSWSQHKQRNFEINKFKLLVATLVGTWLV